MALRDLEDRIGDILENTLLYLRSEQPERAHDESGRWELFQTLMEAARTLRPLVPSLAAVVMLMTAKLSPQLKELGLNPDIVKSLVESALGPQLVGPVLLAQQAARAKADHQGRDEVCAQDAAEPRFFVEALPDFMGRVSQMPAPRWLVPGLIPEDGCTLFHGQPRDGKTLAILDVLLGMATGSPPFGLDRLAPERPCRVLYLTEEDSERRTHERLRLLMAGRGLSAVPDTFSLAVRRGVDLDADDWQAAVIEVVERGRFEFVVFDPLRAFTAHADQGPAELKPFVLYLRRLMRETGCAPGLVHHDTKPRVGTPEDRKRPQRMSGGGLFSVADAPIHVERVDGSRTLLAPTAYKFSDDPRGIVYTLTPSEGALRLVGADADADRAGEVVLEERILAHLAANPGASGRSIVTAVRANRDAVYRALDRLSEAGRVDSVQKGRATHWLKAATP